VTKQTSKKVRRTKKIISINTTIHQEDITNVNKYAQSINEPNFIKKSTIWPKSTNRTNTIIVDDINTT
jgi:hypothetical protein